MTLTAVHQWGLWIGLLVTIGMALTTLHRDQEHAEDSELAIAVLGAVMMLVGAIVSFVQGGLLPLATFIGSCGLGVLAGVAIVKMAVAVVARLSKQTAKPSSTVDARS